jgi:hypothetical protein
VWAVPESVAVAAVSVFVSPPSFLFCQFSSLANHRPPQNPQSSNTHAADPGLPLQYHQAEPHPRFHEYTPTACHVATSPSALAFVDVPRPRLLPTALCHRLRYHTVQRTSPWVMTCPQPERNLSYRNSASRAQRSPRANRSTALVATRVRGVHSCYLAADTGRTHRSSLSSLGVPPLCRHYNHSFRTCFDAPYISTFIACTSPHSARQDVDDKLRSSAQHTPTKNHERTCCRRSSTPTPTASPKKPWRISPKGKKKLGAV